MPKKKSSEIFADFYADISTGKNRMAQAFGVTPDTAQAWSRPKASDINPTGTGKGNPVDQAERAVRIIHAHDPARAREISAYLETVCNELDREAGIVEADTAEHPCRAMARVAESHLQLVLTGLGGCDDPTKLTEALANTRHLKAYVLQLEGCIERLLKTNEEKENG